LECISPDNLRKTLGVNDGDIVEVIVSLQ